MNYPNSIVDYNVAPCLRPSKKSSRKWIAQFVQTMRLKKRHNSEYVLKHSTVDRMKLLYCHSNGSPWLETK